MEDTVKKTPAQIKKEAIADIAESVGFIAIIIKKDEAKRHMNISDIGQGFICLREIKILEQLLLFPQLLVPNKK